MAKKNFAEVKRAKLTHKYTEAPYKTIHMELVMKAESTTKGTVEISRVEEKRFLFFKRTKKTWVASYSIEKLIEAVKRDTWNQEFCYEKNTNYWAEIIEQAWKQAIEKERIRLMKEYDYQIRINEAHARELA